MSIIDYTCISQKIYHTLRVFLERWRFLRSQFLFCRFIWNVHGENVYTKLEIVIAFSQLLKCLSVIEIFCLEKEEESGCLDWHRQMLCVNQTEAHWQIPRLKNNGRRQRTSVWETPQWRLDWAWVHLRQGDLVKSANGYFYCILLPVISTSKMYLNIDLKASCANNSNSQSCKCYCLSKSIDNNCQILH